MIQSPVPRKPHRRALEVAVVMFDDGLSSTLSRRVYGTFPVGNCYWSTWFDQKGEWGRLQRFDCRMMGADASRAMARVRALLEEEPRA